MSLDKSILVSGYYGFDNSGDDAILKAIVKDIRIHNKNIEINVLSNNPEKTKSMYLVNAINRFKIKDVIYSIKKTSLLISGGGSLLQDETSTRSLLYYLALMYLAKFYKKPVMVYANGIGPINRSINRFLTKVILNKVDLITLRDNNSRLYLQSMKVSNNNIIVTADPVFTLDPAPRDIVHKIFEGEDITQEKKLIGISIREWKKATNLEVVVPQVIDYLIKRFDVNVVLIPMHYPEDLYISEKILGKVKESGCFIIKENHGVEEIMGIIKELDLIIAMRLHSLIYAATQAIPMVGLVYDPKVEGILHSLGMDYMCDVEDLKYEELIENINIAWNNREELKKTLNLQREEMKKLAINNVAMAMELMEKGD